MNASVISEVSAELSLLDHEEENVGQTFETTIGSAIGRLVTSISQDRIGTEGLSELKREFHRDVPSPTFWQLLTRDVLGSGVTVHTDQEHDWALILGGMAMMAPHHHSITPFGSALAYSEFPEARLRTLLAVDPGTPRFYDAFFTTIRWLARDAQSANWKEIAQFALTRSPDTLSRLRRKIARDYFRIHTK